MTDLAIVALLRLRASRRRRAAAGLLSTVALVAYATLAVSGALFVASTGTDGSLATTALAGANAPAAGTATFSATANTNGGCDLGWSALSGGTTVADRYEVTDVAAGTSVTTTPVGNVSAGSTSVTGAAWKPYRLDTRTGTNWVSAAGESRSVTCVDPAVVAVSVSTTTACAVRVDGTLWCWGSGEDATNGDPSWVARATPTQVDAATTWTSVAVGNAGACGLHADGSLWCWGSNWSGAVGDGTVTARNTPVAVAVGSTFTQVTAGAATVCAIKSDATLWCWGGNAYGSVGDGTTTDRLTPTAVAAGQLWRWVGGGPSSYTMCAVRADGTLWCWGANWGGQIDATTANKVTPTSMGAGTTWAQVTSGLSHTCALRLDGTLWCVGDNSQGMFGDGTTSSTTALTQVGSATTWSSVATGDTSTCATRADGTLWCAGSNASGRLGLGSSGGRAITMTQVGAGRGWRSASVARTGCGITHDASLWCWGWDGVGATGAGDTGFAAPTSVGAAPVWASVTAANGHACGLRVDRTAWCWGDNGQGQVGDGTTTARTAPRCRSVWPPTGPRSAPAPATPVVCAWAAPCGAGATTPTARSVTAPPASTARRRCRWARP